MTLVNQATGELIEQPSYGSVKQSVDVARESGATFFEQIVWQIENHAWEVLGYSDWDAMREGEYSDMGVVVPRADRPEIVSRLRAQGMTQQGIASTLGVERSTVTKDLNVKNHNEAEPESITNARGQSRPASYASHTPEPVDGGEASTGSGQPEPKRHLNPVPESSADWGEQDRAEELADNLSGNLSLLYAVTNPERRAEYIAAWEAGTRSRSHLGQGFVTPKHMRDLAEALTNFANEWEQANV